MKKFKTAVIAAALAAVMSVSLVSCGGTKDKVTGETSGMTTTVTTKADDKGNTTTGNEGNKATSDRGTSATDTSVGGTTGSR